MLLLQEPEHRDQADHAVQEGGAGIVIYYLLYNIVLATNYG